MQPATRVTTIRATQLFAVSVTTNLTGSDAIKYSGEGTGEVRVKDNSMWTDDDNDWD